MTFSCLKHAFKNARPSEDEHILIFNVQVVQLSTCIPNMGIRADFIQKKIIEGLETNHHISSTGQTTTHEL